MSHAARAFGFAGGQGADLVVQRHGAVRRLALMIEIPLEEDSMLGRVFGSSLVTPPLVISGGTRPASLPLGVSTRQSTTSVLASATAGSSGNCPNTQTFGISAEKWLTQGRAALRQYANNPKNTAAQIRTAESQLAEARSCLQKLNEAVQAFLSGWSRCLPPGNPPPLEAEFAARKYADGAAELAEGIERESGNSRNADRIADLREALAHAASSGAQGVTVLCMALLNLIAAVLGRRTAF